MASRHTAAHQPDGSAGSEELSRVRRGEMSLDDYLDLRAERAVDYLRSQLPEEQLAVVRDTIRAQLESDPKLVELVRAATGRDPQAEATR